MPKKETHPQNHHDHDCACHDAHHHHHHASWCQLTISFLLAALIVSLILFFNPESARIDALLDSGAGYLSLFGFGFLASISHCIMLVGAIFLTSMSWYQRQGKNKWLIIGVFQGSRILAYTLGGATLGFLGEYLQFNNVIGFAFTLIISLLMILFALDFLGIWCWHHSLERYFAGLQTHRSLSLWWLALVGALTFFIPCGFTSTVQVLALSSGSALVGASFLLVFVLGTAIPLTIVALSGSFWQGDHAWQSWLQTIIGWLIIILAVLSLNEALAEIGLPHLEILEHGHEHNHEHLSVNVFSLSKPITT